MWITDPVTKLPSITLTFFTIGFLVALGKLILSGMQLFGIVLSPFSGVDFAAVVAALGGVYAMRRGQDIKNDVAG